MLLKRRDRLPVAMRIRTALWPTRSFERSFRYMLLRLWRIPGSPHSIAIGCAAGVFAIFTPFLGFQMILAALIAWSLRGSILASAVGTFAGNPVTYFPIWISTYMLGNVILGGSAHAEMDQLSTGARALSQSIRHGSIDGVTTAIQGLWPTVKPMALGALPLGGLTAAGVYFLVRHAVEQHKIRRCERAGLRPALDRSEMTA